MANQGVVIVVSGQDKSGEVFSAIQKHLDETKAKAKETNDSLGEMGQVLQRGLQVAGIAIGIREVVSQFKQMVDSSVEMGVQLGRLSQQTGISVENLSVLRYAAQASGIDFDMLARGFKKLAVNVYEADNGNKQAAKGFHELGISTAELKAKGDDMYGIMAMIADKFQTMPDGITKSDAAANIFGARMGSELIPLLNQGGDAIQSLRSKAESLGIVLTKDGVEKLDALHLSLVNLKGAWAGMALEITEKLTPALKTASDNFSDMLNMVRIAPGAVVKGVWGNMLSSVFGSAGPGMNIQMDAAAEFAKADTATHPGTKGGPAPKPVGTDADELAKTAEEAAKKLAEAQKRADDEKLRLADAYAKLAEARAKAESESQIAILDSAHKLGLISDVKYFDQKAALQDAAFKAERQALKAQSTEVGLQGMSEAAKKPKDAVGRLEQQTTLNALKRQQIDIDSKLLALDGQQAAKAAELATARGEALKKQKAQIAEMEAELEKLSGGGASKGVAAQRLKSGDERQNLANGGATPAELAEFDALEKLKEEKLQIEAIDREAEQINRQAAIAEAKVEQDQLSRAISARTADEQLTAIRASQIAQLQKLSAAYAQYGQAGMEAEAKLQQEITQSMAAIKKETDETLKNLGEEIARSLFDPLFDASEKWSKKWKQMTSGLEKDLSKFAENQLMGALFGDGGAGGRGGRVGAPGGPGGRKGLASMGGGLLGDVLGLFGKKGTAVTSNGGLGGGAGTVPDAAASLLQMGKGGNGTGGIQVILNNQGPPMQVSQTQQSGSDGGEGQVIQIILKQLETNGPVAQGIAGLFAL